MKTARMQSNDCDSPLMLTYRNYRTDAQNKQQESTIRLSTYKLITITWMSIYTLKSTGTSCTLASYQEAQQLWEGPEMITHLKSSRSLPYTVDYFWIPKLSNRATV